jgi:hypothetical protein
MNVQSSMTYRLRSNLSPGQPEEWNFRSGIKAHLQEMPDSAAYVHLPAAVEGKLTACIAPILYRKEGWWKKRRLALAAVRVPGQYPPVEAFPYGNIGRVRVMTEGQACGVFAVGVE